MTTLRQLLTPTQWTARRAEATITRLLLGALLAMAAASLLYPITRPIVGPGSRGIVYVVLIFAAVQIIITLRTLILSAQAAAHDLIPEHWTLLVLTGVDARRFVLGRWFALLRQHAHWHILMSLIKYALVLVLAPNVGRSAEIYGSTGFCVWLRAACDPYAYNTQLVQLAPDVLHQWGLTFGIILVFGVLDAMLCTALGIFSAFLWRRAPFFWAIMLRGLVIVALVVAVDRVSLLIDDDQILTGMTGGNYDYTTYQNLRDTLPLIRTTLLASFGLADGGVLISAYLMRPSTTAAPRIVGSVFSALSMIAVLAVTNLALLRLSAWMAVRRGALPAPYWFKRPHFPVHRWVSLPLISHQLRRSRMYRRQWLPILALFGVALALCWIPRWVYIDQNTLHLLALSGITAFSAYVLVAMRTLNLAIHTLSDSEADLLTLSDMSSRRQIISFWWVLTRRAAPLYLLSSVLLLGFAYGLVEYFNAMPNVYGVVKEDLGYALLRPFMYVSYGGCWGYSPHCPYHPVYPEWWQVLLAGIMLAGFGLLNAALTNAVGLLGRVYSTKPAVRMLIAAVLRVWVIVLGLALWLPLIAGQVGMEDAVRSRTYLTHLDWQELIFFWYRIWESLQIAALTLVDGGALAVSNLLRPFAWANRIYYVIRAVFNVLLGMGLYMLLTGATLWLAQRRWDRR